MNNRNTKRNRMNPPKVSVIIPVYNTGNYLRDCLDSVVNQTLKDIEILCADDGSTDGSPAILREYAAKDSRIRVFTQKHSNAGAARNMGLAHAAGEYLAFLDSDDYYEPLMLEHMLACAQDRAADVVVCRLKICDEDSGKLEEADWSVKKELLPEKHIFTFRDIERDCFLSILGFNWDKLFKRSLAEENQLSFQSQGVYNDSLFTYSALVCAKTITVLDEALVVHRYRTARDSISDRRAAYTDCAYRFLQGLKAFLVRTGNDARYERDFVNYAIHLLYIDLIAEGRDAASRKAMKEKIRRWLEEFHANGHDPAYYYHPLEFEALLREISEREETT